MRYIEGFLYKLFHYDWDRLSYWLEATGIVLIIDFIIIIAGIALIRHSKKKETAEKRIKYMQKIGPIWFWGGIILTLFTVLYMLPHRQWDLETITADAITCGMVSVLFLPESFLYVKIRLRNLKA